MQPALDVIFTTDGEKLVAAVGDAVVVYAAIDGTFIRCLKGHKLKALCLSPLLGGGFASGGADKQVIIWNKDLEGILKFSHSDTIQSLSQNSVTGALLSCSASDFGLWTTEVKAVNKVKVSNKIVSSSWTADGSCFALGFYNGSVSIRSPSGDETFKINRSDDSPVWSLAWTLTKLKNHVLVISDWNKTLSFVDLDGNPVENDQNLAFDPLCVANFKKYLLISGSNKQTTLYTKYGVKIGTISSNSGWVWACCGHGTLDYIASASQDGTISVHQVKIADLFAIAGDFSVARDSMTNIEICHIPSNKRVFFCSTRF